MKIGVFSRRSESLWQHPNWVVIESKIRTHWINNDLAEKSNISVPMIYPTSLTNQPTTTSPPSPISVPLLISDPRCYQHTKWLIFSEHILKNSPQKHLKGPTKNATKGSVPGGRTKKPLVSREGVVLMGVHQVKVDGTVTLYWFI